MYNFKNLLSTEIRKKLSAKSLNLIITLSAKDCDQRWPMCRISVDDELIFDSKIVSTQHIEFSKRFKDDVTISSLKIEMYGKTDKDTKIDSNGNIIDNQMMQIADLKLNGVDILKNNLIYRGKFIMKLDDNKITLFKNNNIPTENHDYHFYENGVWTLQIGLPVLTYIINSIKQTETFEKIPYDDTMIAIIQKLEI